MFTLNEVTDYGFGTGLTGLLLAWFYVYIWGGTSVGYSPFTCCGEYGSELESGGDSGRVLKKWNNERRRVSRLK